MFIYFSITLGKLPPWSDFWSEEGTWKLSPVIQKDHLTNLEAFDQHYQRESTRAMIHMDMLYKRNIGSTDVRCPSNEGRGKIKTAEIDSQLRFETLGEIYRGPRNAQADLEAILKHLSEIQQPEMETICSLFTLIAEAGPDSGSRLLSSDKGKVIQLLVPMSRNLKRGIERVLSNQLVNKVPINYDDDVNSLITAALDFMGLAGRVCSQVGAVMDGTISRFKKETGFKF